MAKLKLTEAVVKNLPLMSDGQTLYRDEVEPSFGLLVGTRTKTFVANGRVKGGPERRVTVGRWPTWKVDQARDRARELRTQMDKGIDPNKAAREAAAKGVTLGEAADLHYARMRNKKRADATFDEYKNKLDNCFGDWLGRALVDISKADVQKRHDRLTKERGPYAANGAMRVFRACYNSALKTHDLPPLNPVMAVEFNKEKRRREPIPEEQLPEWYAKIKELRKTNSIRADYNEFVLFTGLRRRDAATVKWEHLNLDDAVLFRPKPKGGEERAFWVPLSAHVVSVLKRRQKENEKIFPKSPWVFPADSESGHLEEPKEYRTMRGEDGKPLRDKKGKKVRVLHLPSPHRLRDTYTTAANSAELTEFDVEVLTNHRPAKRSVTAGYIRQGVEALRGPQQRVTAYLLAKLEPKKGGVVSMAEARRRRVKN